MKYAAKMKRFIFLTAMRSHLYVFSVVAKATHEITDTAPNQVNVFLFHDTVLSSPVSLSFFCCCLLHTPCLLFVIVCKMKMVIHLPKCAPQIKTVLEFISDQYDFLCFYDTMKSLSFILLFFYATKIILIFFSLSLLFFFFFLFTL